ncbi:MAG: L,D-transpeptidase family protein [Phycisphaerales bacterium]|nr:L,D-transpeptidase [Phycisphaerae bacterium]NNM26300.1 L,D-transpeptidase family protein [Phycisphaerales bacterium]
MPLPSQSARPIARRVYMHRRSRRGRRPVAIAVTIIAVVVVGWIGWQLWPDGTGVSDPPAAVTLDTQDTDDDAATTDEDPQRPRERAVTRPPAETRRRDPSPPPARAPETATAAAPSPDQTVEAATARTEPPARTPPPAAAVTTITPETIEDDRSSRVPVSRGDARRGRAALAAGLDHLARNEPIEGRWLLTAALESGGLTDEEAADVRTRLTELNERLVFSPEIVPGDPFSFMYVIESGDYLGGLHRKLGLLVDWRFLQRINGIPSPEKIRHGQRLKIVTGPFHAVVHKRAFRLDLYLGDAPDWVYVRSFDVGLGEYDSTPEGRFRVKPGKLLNPEWVNPRTHVRYLPDDPSNPIGEHWIGLEGAEERLENVTGYGIHGTIEPESIGRQASMGCVRMRPDDVALVWGVLEPRVSVVEIRGD